MGWNVPDDWGSYYYNCNLCGSRYHASEGGCGCTEDMERCVGSNCEGLDGLEGYYPAEDVTEINGKHYCDDCLYCECCEESEGVSYSDEHGLLLCKRCEPEEHWCPAQGPLLDHLTNVVTKAD